eukprot:4641932-Amphidinium_carterae.1
MQRCTTHCNFVEAQVYHALAWTALRVDKKFHQQDCMSLEFTLVVCFLLCLASAKHHSSGPYKRPLNG